MGSGCSGGKKANAQGDEVAAANDAPTADEMAPTQAAPAEPAEAVRTPAAEAPTAAEAPAAEAPAPEAPAAEAPAAETTTVEALEAMVAEALAPAPVATAAEPAAEAPAAEPAKPNWNEIALKIPWETERREERKALFAKINGETGNGNITLAEVDVAVRDLMQLDAVFDATRAIAKAYNAARTVGGEEREYVQWAEFRIMLKYLNDYFELCTLFEIVDSGDDKRISLAEFEASLPNLAGWGITIESPAAEFEVIDASKSGSVSFLEFCDWARTLGVEPPPEDEED